MSIILTLISLRVIFFSQIIIIVLELIVFICINHENNIYKNGFYSFKLLIEFMIIFYLFFLFFSLFLIKLKKRHIFYATFFFFAFLLF